MATVIGTRHIRQDGKEKVTGTGRYTADMTMTGMLHAKFRFADHPRARIPAIDTTGARALPGVFAVITQADVPDVRYGAVHPGPHAVCEGRGALRGRDRRRGRRAHPRDRRAGRGADRGRLRAARGGRRHRASLADGTPLVHDDWELRRRRRGRARPQRRLPLVHHQGRRRRRRWRPPTIVVKGRYVADMSHAVPIEPHAVVAQWQGSKVTVWSSTQVPFIARSGVATTLEIPENQVRIIVPYLGGGFGGKCEFHYEAHIAALARAAGRPVQARLLAPRGVHRARPPPRGHGDRARDRRR